MELDCWVSRGEAANHDYDLRLGAAQVGVWPSMATGNSAMMELDIKASAARGLFDRYEDSLYPAAKRGQESPFMLF